MSKLSLLLILVCLLSLPAFESASQKQTPAPLHAKECGPAKDKNELPKDRFARKGGRETKTTVLVDQGILTAVDIAQDRDLNKYERLNLKNNPSLPQARTFLWEHWRDKKAAYLTLTLSSVDATSTNHVFIEQHQSGRWRVAWRIVRHNGDIDDLPTYYALEWVKAAGWRKPGVPLGADEMPDSQKHQLEFRDVCGDIEQTL